MLGLVRAALFVPLIAGAGGRPPDIPFQRVTVDRDNPPDPHCKAAGDVDGDGFPDLLAASASGGGLFWYRYPDWTKHKIADGSFTTDMAVGDVDGDGFLDVVIPSSVGLMWYRNPRGEGRDPAGPWTATNISPNGANMHDVAIADLNRDGKLDIVTRHQSGFGKRMGNQIHLWVQTSPASWRHLSFPCTHGEGLAVADLNGDRRPDVVIGGRWYENPGGTLDGEWAEHLYMDPRHFDTCWTNGDVAVAVGDLNGDGRPEIALTPAEGKGRLSWFAPPRDPRDPAWTEHVVEPELDHAHALAIADMDRNGHLDLVIAKMHQATPPQEVRVYRNQGRGAAWVKQALPSEGSHNIQIVDIGRTGYPSIFGANWNNASPTHGALELWVNGLGRK